MRLVSYGTRGNELPGALIDDSVLPLSRVLADIGLVPTGTIRSVLPFLDLLGAGIDAAVDRGDELIPLSQTRLGPPIVDPPNLFSCGANYFAHLIEAGMDPEMLPTLPVMFLKPRSTLSGPNDAIVRPPETTQLDYEAELAIVIGKGGHRISADRAAGYIAGYLITNDVSARDLGEGESKRLNLPPLYQVMRMKGWNTFLPTGPWLVTADEVGSYADIRIRTWVNGELRQDASAEEMATNPYELIEWLSATTTLLPGDIITTGTPAGVAMGMSAPKWLMPGDQVSIEMTGLGRMATPVVDERDQRSGGRTR
jgi:2-keto-4-pentenoate hydratase/2-oxohepta-3-ene-1,7-dioic acid hydratase in catechol pathway